MMADVAQVVRRRRWRRRRRRRKAGGSAHLELHASLLQVLVVALGKGSAVHADDHRPQRRDHVLVAVPLMRRALRVELR